MLLKPVFFHSILVFFYYEYESKVVDIDHFKNVNDNYGHLISDKYLGKIADILQTTLLIPS
ncbi:diguanylate cyclase [Colwellia sp. Bg11-12]|uniref:GGDEF domain-containing protein n=1 Tax=Colwellia sp. Bg11-12 TaxID=2759817 RepID=UPI0015F6A845|nr:diguanylate cyclase [Colwellia sp. Bg11-12]MBA6262229.1 diguanylate cyclase [Colwellia sp. Bg11-12]